MHRDIKPSNIIFVNGVATLSDIGLGLAYGIYTTSAFLSFFFVLRWVRETRGVELEEMKA